MWEEGFGVPRMERGLSMNDAITEGYSRQVKDFYAPVYPSSVSKVFTHASAGGGGESKKEGVDRKEGGVRRRGWIGRRGEGGIAKHRRGGARGCAIHTKDFFVVVFVKRNIQ